MKLKRQNINGQSRFRRGIILGIGLMVYGLLVFLTGNTSVCVFKVYTGLPCPGCGMTRAFIAVFQGHITDAFWWHPLWPLVILGPLIYYYFLKLGEKGKAQARILIYAALALLIGVYVVRMILYFPYTAPMDFNDNAIPIKIIRFLGSF